MVGQQPQWDDEYQRRDQRLPQIHQDISEVGFQIGHAHQGGYREQRRKRQQRRAGTPSHEYGRHCAEQATDRNHAGKAEIGESLGDNSPPDRRRLDRLWCLNSIADVQHRQAGLAECLIFIQKSGHQISRQESIGLAVEVWNMLGCQPLNVQQHV